MKTQFIDFDEIFNKRMADMLERHAEEHTEEEWEDIIAKEYQKFGDTVIRKIGKTPRQYFEEMSDGGLVETLKEYLLQELPVSDFLCEEIERRGVFPELLSLLQETDEELVHYAINLIGGDMGARKRYAAMLASADCDAHIKDAVADVRKGCAEWCRAACPQRAVT